jgi:hypothetical protein
MNNTLHTPAPWKSSDRWGNFGDYNRHENYAPNGQVSRHSYSVVDEEGFVVAHCTNPLVTMSSERSEANARLISAAPDLLSALENLMARCVKDAEHYAPDGNEAIWAYISDASDAIAKAKGEA